MRLFLVTTLLFLVFVSSSLWAQDERFFREIFSGDFYKTGKRDVKKKFHFKVHSGYYNIDLTGDGITEGIVYEKKDGEDWVHIHDSNKRKVFSYNFEASGVGAQIYKINIAKVSPKSKVLIFYYYEGAIKYSDFRGIGRLYFLSIDDNDLNTLSMHRGPIYWEEKKEQNRGYFQRSYRVSFYDYNKDGIKEIVIKHHLITRVWIYTAPGNWRQI